MAYYQYGALSQAQREMAYSMDLGDKVASGDAHYASGNYRYEAVDHRQIQELLDATGHAPSDPASYHARKYNNTFIHNDFSTLDSKLSGTKYSASDAVAKREYTPQNYKDLTVINKYAYKK